MKTLIISLLIGLTLVANEPPPETARSSLPNPITVDQAVFEPGEKMVFKVAYTWSAFWLNAGELVFRVEEDVLNETPVYKLKVDGETYKSYEWFYKVKDRYESYIDRETLLPKLFVRDANEGGFIIREDYSFYHDQRKVHTKDYRHDPVKRDSFETVSTVHDVVSAIYYARTIDFAKYTAGDRIPIDIFIDGKTYPIEIRYRGKDRIKTKGGKFDVLVISPTLIENDLFEADDEMIIYVTDDQNKIPVRVESPLTVGSVKADLIGYGGLKYPFEAKVN